MQSSSPTGRSMSANLTVLTGFSPTRFWACCALCSANLSPEWRTIKFLDGILNFDALRWQACLPFCVPFFLIVFELLFSFWGKSVCPLGLSFNESSLCAASLSARFGWQVLSAKLCGRTWADVLIELQYSLYVGCVANRWYCFRRCLMRCGIVRATHFTHDISRPIIWLDLCCCKRVFLRGRCAILFFDNKQSQWSADQK